MALIRTTLTSLLVGLACGCSKSESLETDFEEPHPAEPPSPSSLEATFEVSPESRIEFSVPARQGKPTGYFSRVEGEIWVDLFDLDQAKAELKIDLSSIQMTGEADPALDAERAREAKYWLGLTGADPEERKRFATFVLEEVGASSSTSAHDGKKRPYEDTSSGQSGDEAREREAREVRLTATGSLTLNSVRVRYVAPLSATFYYPAPAISGALPERLELSSRTPVRLSLSAHEIKPRNARGQVLAKDLERLGKEVGREARITANITARRRDP